MKVDYQKTIDILKENKLIKEGDKYAVCWFRTETQNNVFSTTLITSKVDYILIANADMIKLLEIERKTGEYYGSCLIFKKEDIKYAKRASERNFIWASRGLFGERAVGIQFNAEGFNHFYVLPKKMHGFEQKAAALDLYNFIKEVYHPYYSALEKQFKDKV